MNSKQGDECSCGAMSVKIIWWKFCNSERINFAILLVSKITKLINFRSKSQKIYESTSKVLANMVHKYSSKYSRFITLWTIFIWWISAGFLNLIFELYCRIQFKNKVQKPGRFSTLFVNCIYSMNIYQFFNLMCKLYSPILFVGKNDK